MKTLKNFLNSTYNSIKKSKIIRNKPNQGHKSLITLKTTKCC